MATDTKAERPGTEDHTSSGDGEKSPAAAGAGKLKTLAVQAGILIALAGAAFGLNIYVLKPMLVVDDAKEEAKEDTAKAKEEHHAGKILPLDPAVVNIAGTNGRRYLKIAVQIEVPEEEELIKEVEGRKALLSDRLIQILSRQSLEEVTSVGSLDNLKRQIADQFGKELGAERLKNVYLTEFVIQ